VAAAPSDWIFAGEYGFMELEARPEEPYSVNIAYTVVDGNLYANAGDTETQWVKNMASNPLVVVAMDGELYLLHAQRVTDADELARFGATWTRQGSFHRDPSKLDQAWVYRLRPR
jgi:hypothetical protein